MNEWNVVIWNHFLLSFGTNQPVNLRKRSTACTTVRYNRAWPFDYLHLPILLTQQATPRTIPLTSHTLPLGPHQQASSTSATILAQKYAFKQAFTEQRTGTCHRSMHHQLSSKHTLLPWPVEASPWKHASQHRVCCQQCRHRNTSHRRVRWRTCHSIAASINAI